MEITGRIIAVLPEQGGISKTGNEWKKQEYVLETHDQYPKKVCFQLFGADRIAQAAIQPGEELTVFFDIESREYQCMESRASNECKFYTHFKFYNSG